MRKRWAVILSQHATIRIPRPVYFPRMAESRIVELRVRELRQLFDAMDPSPLREQDLVRSVEDYILESIKQLHGTGPVTLRVHVGDDPSASDRDTAVNAIHTHFERRAVHFRRSLRDLLRDGWVSLTIGLTFLVVVFALSQLVVRMVGEGAWGTLVRESMLIGGWVAMWRPLEIFLYDWWPIGRERRQADRLSRAPVEIIVNAASAR